MTAPTLDRRHYLGGSDMPAVLGLVKQRTPLDVWREKTGRAEPFGGNEATDLGTRFEDDVAAIYSIRTGRKVRRDNRELVHPAADFLRGHVDRRIVGERALVEVKCSSVHGWGEPGTDEIPDHVVPQVHTYLELADVERCDVVALLWGGYGPPRVEIYPVQRDRELGAMLVEQARRFWHEHVVADVPPEPADSAEASALWSRATSGKALVASRMTLDTIDELLAIKAEQKRIEARRDELELAIKAGLRDGEAYVHPETGRVVVSWKQQTDRRFDASKFAEAHPELHEQFKVEQVKRVLRTHNSSKRAGTAGAKDEVA